MPVRPPTSDEIRFLQFLIDRAAFTVAPGWTERLMVSPMDEGGMGSLLLFPEGTPDDRRVFGETVVEYVFRDADRVEVVASLNTDSDGHLFELDIWKMTFDPLIRFPDVHD